MRSGAVAKDRDESRTSGREGVIYSIITSCRSRGIDPHAYLKDVLRRLTKIIDRQTSEITPASWAKSNLGRSGSERRPA